MTQIWRPVHKHLLVRLSHQCVRNMIACFKVSAVILNHSVCTCTIKNLLLNQLISIKCTRGGFFINDLIHQWLCCGWFIRFIMTTAAITEQINDNIFTELMTEVMGDLSRKNYSFRIIPIDMEDRCLNHFCNIGTVFGRTGITWIRRGKTNLIVHNNMNSTTNRIATSLRHLESFHVHTLTCKRRITMNNQW